MFRTHEPFHYTCVEPHLHQLFRCVVHASKSVLFQHLACLRIDKSSLQARLNQTFSLLLATHKYDFSLNHRALHPYQRVQLWAERLITDGLLYTDE